MNVLVTGNLGYNGSILVKELKDDNHFVVGLDIGYFLDNNFLPIKNFLPHVQIFKDIRKLETSDLEKFNFDAIIHLAALSNDPLGELSPDLTYGINFGSTKKLFQLAVDMTVKHFIYVSSCSTYGRLDENKYADEQTKLEPLTAYAKSKVASEEFLLSHQQNQPRLTIMRCATMFGISPFLRLDLVVNNLTAQAFIYKHINVTSDGTPWRPLIHVKDFARATKIILNQKATGIFNVGFNSMNFRIRDIGIEVSKICKADLSINKDKTPDERSYRVNFSKIEKLIGSKPLFNLQDGINELFKNFKEYSLSKDDFESGRFNRLKTLKNLISSKIISDDLYMQ